MTAVASLSIFTRIQKPTKPRVNWWAIITELEAAGVSQASIATLNGVAKGTISNWKAEGEPRHDDGEYLKALYLQTFPERTIPMQTVRKLNAT